MAPKTIVSTLRGWNRKQMCDMGRVAEWVFFLNISKNSKCSIFLPPCLYWSCIFFLERSSYYSTLLLSYNCIFSGLFFQSRTHLRLFRTQGICFSLNFLTICKSNSYFFISNRPRFCKVLNNNKLVCSDKEVLATIIIWKVS